VNGETISSPYEIPENPEIRVETLGRTAEEVVEELLKKLEAYGIRPPE
jgi:adenylylsulfate kinase-like enzyme